MLSSVFLLLLISTGCHFQTFRRDSNISCYSDDDWAERSYKQLTGISNRPSDNITVIVRELATHVIIFLNNRESNILLDVYLTVYWHDHRFIIPPSEIVCQNRWRLDSTTAERMWKPKLNFHGALEAKWHDLPYRNEFLWADGNGTVTYQQKLRLKIPCKLNFDRFPMDEARCFINFAEMEYDDNKVKLNWTKARDPIRNFFKNRNTEEHKFDKHFHQHHMSVSTQIIAKFWVNQAINNIICLKALLISIR